MAFNDEMIELKGRVNEQYLRSLETSLDYEKSFGRYLVVGSGAAIIFILSSYRQANNALLSSEKFEVVLWLFTASILISAFNIYLSMTVSSKYANSFLMLQKLINDTQLKISNPEISEENKVRVLLGFDRSWKEASIITRPYQRALSGLRIAAALTFSVALIVSIYLVTRHY